MRAAPVATSQLASVFQRKEQDICEQDCDMGPKPHSCPWSFQLNKDPHTVSMCVSACVCVRFLFYLIPTPPLGGFTVSSLFSDWHMWAAPLTWVPPRVWVLGGGQRGGRTSGIWVQDVSWPRDTVTDAVM